MTACLSMPRLYAIAPIYVLSQIPRLKECMKEFALPGMQVKSVDLPMEFNKNVQLTEEQLKEVELAEIVVCDKFILANTYKHLPNLKWAHCTWAGLEDLFDAIPEQPKFMITRHAGEAFSAIMAEYVMCQILNHERSNKTHWKNQEAKTWQRVDRFETYRSLDELTVGILGVGSMGTGVAMFLEPRGTTLLGFCRTQRASFDHYFKSISIHLEEILPHCDYIINTLPSTPSTKGILNKCMLKHCSKKPVFINVGRGDVISEYELVHALSNEWISAAVLDVFEEEPLPESSQLWKIPQVTITPHVAAVSKPEHVAKEFFKKVKDYIDGDEIKNTVNWNLRY
ncbi:glyoxylate/hydroxypyruvate reductase A-like [Uloborus diversus]|uniref:glyoxylate/hydroxypyruvate reductase A-like n=1 Tax=Uloborus diversus TaxID=327109 RepID=UPI0024097FD0|nr:glyoxylate/hydroxypyruvate reductase A-like [Uloborus diversus]XP_054709715.1 glyoxylate/hydroxypyruvate reductase A-like [Uloborus diversus]